MSEFFRGDFSQANIAETMQRVESREDGRVSEIASELSRTVFFQENAADSVARALVRSESSFNDSTKPLASLMFLGPSGVGKTEMAHAMSQHLFKFEDSDRLKILNMAEFQESHSVSKIVGSPPSYVGHGEQSMIPHKWLNKEQKSIIVFDEIEKAHPAVHRMLLGILDKGKLSARNGEKGFEDLNFNNSFLIFTSNLGAQEIQDATEGKSMGFHRPTGTEAQAVDVKAIAERELANKYAPEFIKRFDDTVVFNPLRREEGHYNPIYYKFFERKNNELKERFESNAPFLWSTDEAREWVLDQAGNKGGREVRRVVEKEIFTRAAELFGEMDMTGRPMVAGVEEGKVVFFTDSVPLEDPPGEQVIFDNSDTDSHNDTGGKNQGGNGLGNLGYAIEKAQKKSIPDMTKDDMDNTPSGRIYGGTRAE